MTEEIEWMGEMKSKEKVTLCVLVPTTGPDAERGKAFIRGLELGINAFGKPVDLTKDADWIQEGTLDDAKCKITISDEDWVGIIDGTLNAQQAFMSGKLKVAGDMSLALKLQSLLG